MPRCWRRRGRILDFATVNVSSPNTERLRELQGAEALRGLLAGVAAANRGLEAAGAGVSQDRARHGRGRARGAGRGGAGGRGRRDRGDQHHAGPRAGSRAATPREAGGLSGAPLFARSTAVLARVHALTGGRLPLVGVGGVGSAEARLRQDPRRGVGGAALYRARLRGARAGAAHPRGLDALLARDGFASVAEAVGTGAAWAQALCVAASPRRRSPALGRAGPRARGSERPSVRPRVTFRIISEAQRPWLPNSGSRSATAQA